LKQLRGTSLGVRPARGGAHEERRNEPDRLLGGGAWAKALNAALWPIAVMSILHRTLILAVNEHITDDFSPVYQAGLMFLRHQPVYTQTLAQVEPHYLYPPSGTLLLCPITHFDPITARFVFIILTSIAIIGADLLLLRFFDLPLRSFATPAILAGTFLTESVTNTLTFTNVNGFVFLAEAVFLLAVKHERPWLGGVALGLTFAVKPVLAPLLLIPLLLRWWKTFVMAFAIPAALLVVGGALSVDGEKFYTDVLPYLVKPRDYYNSAIVGYSSYFGVAPWLCTLQRVFLAALVLVSLWWLYKRFRHTDLLLWASMTAGLALVATFLLGSLAQGYYSLFLIPMALAVVRPGSPMRSWVVWLGLYGSMTLDWWEFQDPFHHENPPTDLVTWLMPKGRSLEYLKFTFGWTMLIVGIFLALWLAKDSEARDSEAEQGGEKSLPLTHEQDRADADEAVPR
jgi:arabinofuranan 3-O-arabinosyltransferase